MKNKLIISGVMFSLMVGAAFYVNYDNLVEANGDYTCTFDLSSLTYSGSSYADVARNDGDQSANYSVGSFSNCAEGAVSSWNKGTHKGTYVGVKRAEVKGYTYGNTRTGCDGRSWRGAARQNLKRIGFIEEICSYVITDEKIPTTNTSYENN